jgi:programmed cell death protein 5
MDDELEEIRRKKLEQLKRQMEYQEAIEEKEYLEEERKKILSYILTSPARQRLARVRMARPEFAEAIENQLILLVQSGKLQHKITDEELKELLSQIVGRKRDIRIRRRGL